MHFLWKPSNHFNLANLTTFANLTFGLLAVFFITETNYFFATIFIWIAGIFDIIDGKIARKFHLSNQFGIQLDSFADFLSFVLVPVFLVFHSIFQELSGFNLALVGFVSIIYVISGLRRLVQFNINADEGEVANYFTGVPTPLGAILIWFSWLSTSYIGWFGVAFLMLGIALLLNSKIKIKHL